jgi:hypothetical protein
VLRPSLELTVGTLRRTVASAGLRDDELSAVLLAGGSSQVPLVRQLLSEAFEKPVRVAHHPKFTVALGAASVAARALAEPRPIRATGVDAAVPPPVEQRSRMPRRGRWLVPAAAVVLAAIAATGVSLVLGTTTITLQEGPPTSASEPSSVPPGGSHPPTEKKAQTEPPPKEIKLRNEETDMCVGIRGASAGTPANNILRQFPCDEHPDANQKWFYTVPHPKAGPDGRDLMMFSHIRDENDDDWYCFDIPGGGGRPAGTKVVVSACNGNLDDNQQWWLERDPKDGTVRIHNYAAAGRCVALERDEAWPEGAPLTIEECDDDGARWFMVETGPSGS